MIWLASAICADSFCLRCTADYQTDAVAILFPNPKKAGQREYSPRAQVWPLEGNTNLAFRPAERNTDRALGNQAKLRPATRRSAGDKSEGRTKMKERVDRRSFLRVLGLALGTGVVYEFAPLLARHAGADTISDFFKQANGEAPASFTFAQFSDTHVGFQGPPDPLGTKAFEGAVELMNRSKQRPDFVLFTGDLTHDVPNRDVHAQRMQLFKSIAARINTPVIHAVPGENDAALDGGVLYREHFGDSHYSFDHKGVHFIALDNVSQGSPEVGAQQLDWLKADLARFPKTTPIILFTHRPLFDLKPEWEWFTRDGDQVMNLVAPYENVTVLYGHIHRHNAQQTNGRVMHYATRSLIFAFNDPATNTDKKPLPFDKDDPFKELGIRLVNDQGNAKPAQSLDIKDIVLTKTEFSGVSGIQQMIKSNPALGGSSSNEAD
jgi:predicted phosphodiesterase